ncbi:uncharacterized protein M421DRAFT_416564 [Didymella exigua CBS 183.55]|uniref:Uncharacterized protein n=1 Tax=Didymella exigua CBS 183.55 TaxID=1150837 RepID=A0A6A5S3B9_9PLEO|nr:uncharacterized protein M421DRAFT_416564 [Didymella exigua CBS 183.55]KAF1932966.1 hypothetical protein M421DRAFT_416564 [Didymella exigua CBS 183.55]
MPSSSHLRLQHEFEPFTAETVASHFIPSPIQKKQKMSLTQTYYIASSARSKLGKEACRADHDLRLLVGHANLLDSLMIELQDAERQQEAWFNQTMAKASRTEDPRHIQWADSIAEEDEDSDSDSDFESECDDDFDMIPMPRRITQAPIQISTMEVDEDEDEEDYYDDMEDDAELTLTRVPSQVQSPPELVYEEDSEDDSPPTSPPTASLAFSEKEAMLTTTFYASKTQSKYIDDDEPLFMDTNAPLISSY